jgi:undecaprenyl diphosphate synthase
LKQKKPQHIAIVMDGNGRWAAQRGLERIEGHVQGVQVAKKTVEACLENEIEILSLFAFSNENWARPKEEVQFLMDLFLQFLKTELAALKENGVRLKFLGSREGLSNALIHEMNEAETLTMQNHRLILNIALNYSGKWDILNAVNRILECSKQGLFNINDLSEAKFGEFLSTENLVEPDLFIRTSGEQRISNFFLWQIAYTELYFTRICWPDFDKTEFMRALEFYASRERRYGKTSQQIKDKKYV